ncbi:MAG: hypothetical protein LBS19_01440, partial [Clostridiales bacterium]|nr:hypothetical protein [Clostridiales bacterium]
MNNFVYHFLNCESYVFARVEGLPYPSEYYFMPEEEYNFWAARLFGSGNDGWKSFEENFTVDKNTLIEAAEVSEAQAAHWPEGRYVGVDFSDELEGYDLAYDLYARHIRRVESIHLREDSGVDVTLHYNPEGDIYFTSHYIDVSFRWDEELGFIVESMERRESEASIVAVNGNYTIIDSESEVLSKPTPDLHDEAGIPFELTEGERIRNQYTTDRRILVITNRKCYAFDSSDGKLADSKRLPDFLVSEDEEDSVYDDFVVDDDLTEISYILNNEYPEYYDIYICPLDGSQEPRILLELDPDKDEIDQEYYHVARFLDHDRLLMYVGGWEWVWRYEVMD